MDGHHDTYTFESKRPWLSPWQNGNSKEITLYFRTNPKIYRSLEIIAEKKQQPLTETLATIIEEYVKSREDLAKYTDKRHGNRKSVSVPAIVAGINTESSEPYGGFVLDVSLGGLCVSLSGCDESFIDQSDQDSSFKVSFMVPEMDTAVTMVCEPKWSRISRGNMHVGARFIGGDLLQYQTLQQFIMQ
jgi:hypothetical protein